MSQFFWNFVDAYAWDNKIASQDQEEAMFNRVKIGLSQYTRNMQIALLEAFEAATEAMIKCLQEHSIDGQKLKPEVEYIVGLGSETYKAVMMDTALVMGYHQSQTFTFKQALVTALTPQQEVDTDEVYFWSFIQRLRDVERQMVDWEEEAVNFLQEYPAVEQQSFKRTFFRLREALVKRVQKTEQAFEPSQCNRIVAFAITQGQQYYYEAWQSPSLLFGLEVLELGDRGDLFAYAQQPIPVLETPEDAPPLTVPLQFLQPQLSLSIVRAFKEGQATDNLAEEYGVDKLVIEALLRLVWALSDT